MIRRALSNRTVAACLGILLLFALAGGLAPWLAPNDPDVADVINTLAPMSFEFPLGTDAMGRCLLSRVLYGIRTTLFYSLLTMGVTVFFGTLIGLASGYVRGKADAAIMRLCDVMLSFPYEIIVLSIVGFLGPGLANIIVANFVAKLAWYVRMVRSSVLKYEHFNYLLYSRAIGSPRRFILCQHLLLNIASEVIVLATLDLGWIILSISTLSFLGLGVQAPQAEWGAMLSEAREVLFTHPEQMLVPGVAIMIVVACCNLMGDSLRDVLDPKAGG
jgi:nickel transport system permease protein